MAVVVAIHGPSGSGKTTLIEQLIPRLRARWVSVGVIKHAHEGVVLDRRGKDSQRFWDAGVETVLVASPQEVFVRERRSWSALRELFDLLPQHLDCVLIEGFTHTIAAVDVPVSVTVEMTPDGVRLDGQLLCCNDIATTVEAAVMSRLRPNHVLTGSGGRSHERP